MNLILASKSPRRKELLEKAGYTFKIHPAIDQEVFDSLLPLDDALKKVAEHKAQEVGDLYEDCLVLAADTIVCFEGKILGKPKDMEDAFQCLCSLSNQTHQVKTAVALLFKGQIFSFVETSEVHFRSLSDMEILSYVQSGRCMDKAGAYGIQECDFVEWLDGSYSNVVGLPMERLEGYLVSLGHF